MEGVSKCAEVGKRQQDRQCMYNITIVVAEKATGITQPVCVFVD
jgi:hypothetical protein